MRVGRASSGCDTRGAPPPWHRMTASCLRHIISRGTGKGEDNESCKVRYGIDAIRDTVPSVEQRSSSVPLARLRVERSALAGASARQGEHGRARLDGAGAKTRDFLTTIVRSQIPHEVWPTTNME